MIYVRKAGVVGAGTMGAAIAEVLALNEIPVVLKDVSPPLVERGLSKVKSIVDELVAVQGSPVDLGGYYDPDPRTCEAVMRPSAAFNEALTILASR